MTRVLDSTGRGQYGLVLPPATSLVGTRLYTTFISADLALSTIQTIGQTMSFVIEP